MLLLLLLLLLLLTCDCQARLAGGKPRAIHLLRERHLVELLPVGYLAGAGRGRVRPVVEEGHIHKVGRHPGLRQQRGPRERLRRQLLLLLLKLERLLAL